jgi:phosphomevalonate kinase
VVSGAYAVLEGAPALVAAVSRYAAVNTEAGASFITEEVAAALTLFPYRGQIVPSFDAEELRSQGRKLGLGSSAAILVATLAALEPSDLETAQGLQRLFEVALSAHRAAQGGGSGIDVAASVYGGVLRFQMEPHGRDASTQVALPSVRPALLPSALWLEVWASDVAASTSAFLARVRDARTHSANAYAELMRELTRAATEVAAASDSNDAATWLSGLRAQALGLAALGELAQVPIFTPELHALHALAEQEQAVVLPAGAGGGDIAIYAGLNPPTLALREALPRFRHERLELSLGARGVHRF